VTAERIGRTAEAQAIQAALGRAVAGEPQIVLLDGEAGAGKTFLLRSVLESSAVPVFRGDTSEFATSEFGPVKDLLHRLERDDAVAFAALRAAHPIVAVALGQPVAVTDCPPTPDALLQALAQMLLALAGDGPAVAVFDDLHVADHATVELLDRLGTLLRAEPLLVVVAHRSDDLDRHHPLRRLRRQWLRRRTGVTAISLPALTPAETMTLAASRLGAPPSQSLGDEIVRLSSGIPLYVEELVAAMVERGAVRLADGTVTVAEGSVPVPESLREAVLVRMASLDPSAQRTLERAAVMGLEVDLELLGAAVDDDSSVALLIETQWLIDTEPAKARFRHALVREALYAQIPWSRRRQWHAECATALEAAGRSADAIAMHWLAAHDRDRARRAFLVRAQRAGALHAHADAAAFLSRALDLWREGVDEAQRLDTLCNYAEHAQLARRCDDAVRAWHEVCERAERGDDAGRIAQARRRLAVFWALAGEVERSVEEREAAAAAFLRIGQHRDAAQELVAAADMLNLVAKWRAVIEVVERAWPHAIESGALELQVLLQSQRGRAMARMGRIEDGLREARTAVAKAEEHGLTSVVGYAYQRLADCHEHRSEYGAARDMFLKAADRCALEGSTMQYEACRACALAVLLQNGEWPLAMRIADEVAADPASPGWARTFGVGVGGVIQAMKGEFRSARTRLHDGLRSARAGGFRGVEPTLLRALAVCEWFEGRPLSAAEYAHAALKRWSEGEEVHHIVATACLLAALFAASDDEAGVVVCVGAASTAARATGQAEALAGLAFTMGESQLVGGSPAQAAGEFNTALKLAEGLPLPFWRAGVLRGLAEAEARLRNETAAVDHLRLAIDGFESLGAMPFAQEATQRLAQLAPDALRSADVRRQHGGLTVRQRQILACVAKGSTDKEIARQLGLSPRTIEMHVGRTLATLRCRTRSEAVARAVELRLLGA
jgi:DNA-binding CsgD family transcriptional regulator